MVAREKVSLDEFKQFVSRDDNTDKLFELINGEIIEVMPGRTYNSEVSFRIANPVFLFCREHNLPYHVSGEAGAYQVGEHVLVPDFAYKRTPMSKDYPDPVAPLWAVEVISPTDKVGEIRKKREIYRAANILLWEIYPDDQSVDVYAPNQPVRTLRVDEVLDGGVVLPDFTLPVRDLFTTP
jgi:Uma2 family endonuclease